VHVLKIVRGSIVKCMSSKLFLGSIVECKLSMLSMGSAPVSDEEATVKHHCQGCWWGWPQFRCNLHQAQLLPQYTAVGIGTSRLYLGWKKPITKCLLSHCLPSFLHTAATLTTTPLFYTVHHLPTSFTVTHISQPLLASAHAQRNCLLCSFLKNYFVL